MEYQKITNLLDNIPNQPSKFRTRHCLEINNESCGTCKNRLIRIKNLTLRSSLCDYSCAYILLRGTITIDRAEVDDAAKRLHKRIKGVIILNFPPIVNYIS